MPRERQSKYFWPSSALTEADMRCLFVARETSVEKTTISRLIAHAVRQTYGEPADVEIHPEPRTNNRQHRKAA